MHHIPKKRLSQNFLIDSNISRKIVDASHLSPADTVLEIGCGQGALTGEILRQAHHIYGVEFDRQLYSTLKQELKDQKHFTLFEADILEFDFDQIPDHGNKIKVIGNLPYHISSPIIFRLIDQRDRINTATIMLQKEVALRLVSEPSSKDYGILSVFCQYFAVCKRLFDIPPSAFFPRPKVESSIVQLTFRDSPPPVSDFDTFKQVVKRSFNQRRKMLRNSLSAFVGKRSIDFNLQLRPEQLSVDEFIRLTDLLYQNTLCVKNQK
ncbi:ribosomal RNA small subunit methyltransferase A [bacterium]|nr:MAG: ribosomal RNA small subunit methyltransferase A [bacterium]